MKSIVIVNPNRYTGYSYITYAKKFLPDYRIISLWTSKLVRKNFATTAVIHCDLEIYADDYEYSSLFDLIKKYDPKCFMVGDDSAFVLADKLQFDFFPDNSNVESLRQHRTSKKNYLEFLSNKNLITTKQFPTDKAIIIDLDFNKEYVLKPVNGAGNENVFVVKDLKTIEKIVSEKRDLEFVIQEFVDGEEYCIEICSFHGVHKCTMASLYKGNYLVENINPWREENQLVSPKDPNVKIIYEYVSEILDTLGIKIGMTWTQVKIKNGTPHLIEINFRSQGHGIFQYIHKATGGNYATESFKSYLGGNQDLSKLMYNKLGNWNKICVNNHVMKFIDKIEWNQVSSLNSDVYVHQYASIPSNLPLTRNFKTTIGMILIQNTDDESYLKDYDFIKKWKRQYEF